MVFGSTRRRRTRSAKTNSCFHPQRVVKCLTEIFYRALRACRHYVIHEPDYARGAEESFVLSSIVLPFFFRLSAKADVIERKRVI